MSKKIIWNVTESADWHAAFLEALKDRKVPLPLTADRLHDIMEAAREAVKVLKVERRRPMTSIDSIRGDVAKRLIDMGVFPRNYLTALRRSKSAKAAAAAAALAPDPREEVIAGLQAELLALKQKEVDLLEQVQGLIDANMQLRNQPSPLQIMQRVVAETIAMALGMAEQAKRPAGVTLPGGAAQTPKPDDAPPVERREREELPQFEKDRRKNPLYQWNMSPNAKPKFALVADFVGSDKALIHKGLSDIAEVRYLDAPNKFHGLGVFNANGGRIVLWADHSPHTWEEQLKRIGVSYRVHRGSSINSLVQSVKDAIQK